MEARQEDGSQMASKITAAARYFKTPSPSSDQQRWVDIDESLAAARGRSNRIRQVAQPTQNPKRHLDRFSRFCTAHGI